MNGTCLRFAVALATLGAWTIVPASAQPPAVRTVLAVHAGAEDHPANRVLDTAIRNALLTNRDQPIEYLTEYLESDRFPTDVAGATLADYIRTKYADRRIDVVISITSQAMAFVLHHRPELFPDAAVVYTGLGRVDERVRADGRGVTGVVVGIAYAETLRVALALHPGTQRVFVVAKSRDVLSVDVVRNSLHDAAPGVILSYIDEPTVPRLLETIRGIPPGSLILYIWHAQDEPGYAMYPDQVASMVAEHAAVPIYGTSDMYLGLGVVGGVVRSTYETGGRLGEMARQILGGTRAQDIPIETSRVVPTFDWRQLRRWSIDPSRLPPGSDIRFRVPTVWESYRGYVLGTVIVVAGQLVLIAGLLTQRARRRRAEQTIRAREAMLRTSYERIQQLAGRLINAQDATRAGIARELHDGVCQDLAGVATVVSGLKRSAGDIQDPSAQKAFTQLEWETRSMFESIRRLSHDLHPATLRLLGLAQALKTHCSEVASRHAVDVSFTSEPDVASLHPDVAVCLFRIAQEALRNGVVHGEASHLSVSIARSGDEVELAVTDDGRGFDVEAIRANGGGLGLVSMKERARLLGGVVEIVAAPGRGTSVRARVSANASPSGDPRAAELY